MKIWIAMIWCLLSFGAMAQSEEVLENMMETRPDEDLLGILENRAAAITRKINLNEVTVDQLAQMNILTEEEIQALLQHRTNFGAFIDILELQQCLSDANQIARLKEMVFVPRSYQANKMYNHHHEIYFTNAVTIVKNDAQNISDASPQKSAIRYRYRGTKGHEFGATLEKDALEKYFPIGLKGGFDHNSGYAVLQYSEKFRLFLGDYLASFGQGLTIGQGFQTGKSALVMDISQKPRGISPNRSVDENRFFRGVAISHQLGDFQYCAFGSRMRKDASLNNDEIGAFNFGGMHRTASEMKYKDAVLTNEIGINANYSQRIFSIGISSMAGKFDKPFGVRKELYKRHDFHGDQYFRSGLNHTIQVQNIRLFGEISIDQRKKSALLQGIQWSLDKGFDIGIVHRKYAPGFAAFNSQGFGESAFPENENGTYLSAQLQVNQFTIATSSDFFKNEWPNFGDLTGTSGSDYLVQAMYKHSRKTQIYGRYRVKTKDSYQKINEVSQLTSITTEKWRLHAEHKIGLDWRLRSRLELATYRNGSNTTTGEMLYFDVQKSNLLRKIDLTWRIMLSSSENFDSRIYVFENDLPLSYSMPYFDKPIMRSYLLCHLQINENIDFWFKYAFTFQQGNVVQEAGRMYIASDLEQEFKFQIRFRL